MFRRIIALASLFALAGMLLVPARATQAAERLCFAQVPDCIEGRFAEFWQENGGLAVFGLPKSPAAMQEIEGRMYLVQQFERNRFELHPENPRPYDVLLGRLGDDLLKRRGIDWNTFPKAATVPANCVLFAETGHSICEPFLTMYRANGLEFDGNPGKSMAESMALFGLPLSEPQMETLSDGNTYLVQWFERARFELHPQNAPPFNVLLGLLGNEIAETPAAPAPAPAPEAPAAPAPPPLPTTDNAYVEPERGPRGTEFVFIAAGFEPGEMIGVYITAPDQSVYGAPFQVQADEDGFSEPVGFTTSTNPNFPTGVFAMTFEGTRSGVKGIAYFEVTP